MTERYTSPEQNPLDLACARADLILASVPTEETDYGALQQTLLATRAESGVIITNYKLIKRDGPDNPGDPNYSLEIPSPEDDDEQTVLNWRRSNKKPDGRIMDDTKIIFCEGEPELSDKIAEILGRSVAYNPAKQAIVPGYNGAEDRIVTVGTIRSILRKLGFSSPLTQD